MQVRVPTLSEKRDHRARGSRKKSRQPGHEVFVIEDQELPAIAARLSATSSPPPRIKQLSIVTVDR